MKALVIALFLLSTAAGVEDTRQSVTLPAPAQEVLRQEMLDNLVAVNEILSLMAAGKVREAGDVAESKLGRSAMGKHRDKPFEAPPARTCRRPCTASAWMATRRPASSRRLPRPATATRRWPCCPT